MRRNGVNLIGMKVVKHMGSKEVGFPRSHLPERNRIARETDACRIESWCLDFFPHVPPVTPCS
jgi:hypothetical protein